MNAIKILFITLAAMLATACIGTQEAYKAADGLDETAYVVGEHYSALLEQVLAQNAAGRVTGEDWETVQAAIAKTTPAVLALVDAGEAYRDYQSADTEAALQFALSKAAKAITDLINVFREAGGVAGMDYRDGLQFELAADRAQRYFTQNGVTL